MSWLAQGSNRLECQDCGDPVGTPLTPAQRQQVASDPYRFVVYCAGCRRDRTSAYAGL